MRLRLSVKIASSGGSTFATATPSSRFLPHNQPGIGPTHTTPLKPLQSPTICVSPATFHPRAPVRRQFLHLYGARVISDTHTCRNGEPGRSGGVVEPAECERGMLFRLTHPLRMIPTICEAPISLTCDIRSVQRRHTNLFRDDVIILKHVSGQCRVSPIYLYWLSRRCFGVSRNH